MTLVIRLFFFLFHIKAYQYCCMKGEKNGTVLDFPDRGPWGIINGKETAEDGLLHI